MKIPNYDTKQESSKSLNDFLDEDFRILIDGQTRCGKRNTLMHILRTPLVYYDKIYIFSPTHRQKLMEKISEDVGYPILEIGGENDIPNTNEYPINNRKVLYLMIL